MGVQAEVGVGNRNGPVDDDYMHENWLRRLAMARDPLGLLAPVVDALSVIDDFHFSYT